MSGRTPSTGLGISLLVTLVVPPSAWAGDLNPPAGPVAPTMKALDRVEPRVPVETLAGSATALHVISQAGSYYLSGNITGVSGKNGIEILVDDVTLDLNGFVVRGVEGSLNGILAGGACGPATKTNIAIRSGTVRNWGGDGVNVGCGASGLFEDIRASHNSGRGVYVGSGSVQRCVTQSNGSHGIAAGTYVTLRDCSAGGNGGDGINVAQGAEAGAVIGCTAKSNSGVGIRGNAQVLVKDCVSSLNAGGGIQVGANSLVIDCIQ